MKVYREIIDISEFKFWSGACYTVKALGIERTQIIWGMLSEISEDIISETQVNDFFWFDTDTIAEWLGFEDWEDFLERKDEDEE